MPEIFAKIAQVVGTGFRSVAAGKTQANLGIQSPHLAGAIVRLGRFAYFSFGTVIGISWYTGYVNQRTKKGEIKWILPGGSLPVINTPDRPDKKPPIFGGSGSSGITGAVEDAAKAVGVSYQTTGTFPTKGRTLAPITAQQLGTPGIAGYLFSAPKKELPEYSAARYRGLLSVASAIEKQFHLTFTSGYRPQSDTLHGVGLAFDQVGRMSDMKRAAAWAAQNPGLFQEVFIHDAGSGMHLHLGFYPDAADIYNNSSTRYSGARTGKAPAPAVAHLGQLA
jgi:hypothetical protein